MIETINGKAYLKVGDKVYELGGGGGIDVASAKVGQTIKVKAIDENGKPTEWESADFPEIGESNIYTYDSLDEVPSDLPEGSFVAVPEKVFDLTAMGFPVVTLAETALLRTDTTEIYNAFSRGSIAFTFDFLQSGNKVTVHTGSTFMPSVNSVSGSTIVYYSDAYVVANIVVTKTQIQILTKVLA